jgi:amidohydrolase
MRLLTAATLLTFGAWCHADLDADINERAAAVTDQVIAWRRDIHEHPELSNREVRTAALVAAHLRALGMDVTTGVARTGVVGVLRGGKAGKVVALRATSRCRPAPQRAT